MWYFIMKSGGKRALCHSGKNMYVFIRQLEKVGGGTTKQTHNDLILFFGGLPVKPRKVTLSVHHFDVPWYYLKCFMYHSLQQVEEQ